MNKPASLALGPGCDQHAAPSVVGSGKGSIFIPMKANARQQPVLLGNTRWAACDGFTLIELLVVIAICQMPNQ